ncbi:hypothetical protein SARC_00003 [Sphaeroforma arctica JP610]|uniref:Uncharacterized protein n=1 Tax=Sphaeroforma arctica JP610 TaxID=667725 RepID=A0A0L0GG70_9EUKA|nr:hypothetical protein SARC_00003 [Sphaeroforma arctica JP610]KNC87869.1 hypothetical protein SARC_00003 [Sphaeroforma arctica JP610]|eukprot:XP_014161771.1 hypothetical protein SARC_00003 [Sphaeroforma arctica JP610]
MRIPSLLVAVLAVASSTLVQAHQHEGEVEADAEADILVPLNLTNTLSDESDELVEYKLTFYTGNGPEDGTKGPVRVMIQGEQVTFAEHDDDTLPHQTIEGEFLPGTSKTVIFKSLPLPEHAAWIDIWNDNKDGDDWYLLAGVKLEYKGISRVFRYEGPVHAWKAMKRASAVGGNIVPHILTITTGDAIDAELEGGDLYGKLLSDGSYESSTQMISHGVPLQRNQTIKTYMMAPEDATDALNIWFNGSNTDMWLLQTVTVQQEPTTEVPEPPITTIDFKWWLQNKIPILMHRDFDDDALSLQPNEEEGVEGRLRLPDLQIESDNMLRNLVLSAGHIWNDHRCAAEEGCFLPMGSKVNGVIMGSWRRFLRFSATYWNYGDADFFPNPDDNPEWHECHNHYHALVDFAKYTITKAGSAGNQVELASAKQSHCAVDSICEDSDDYNYKCANQGITKNCADQYGEWTDCQWIDITPLKSGWYVLNAYVNMNRRVRESDYSNNGAHVLFRFNADGGIDDRGEIDRACVLEDWEWTECPGGEDASYDRSNRCDSSSSCLQTGHLGSKSRWAD